MSEKRVSEVLDLAADALQQRGWAKSGWNNHTQDKPLCLEGAIAAALGITANFGHSTYSSEYEQFQVCPAYMAVKDYLNQIEGDLPLYWFNDTPGRTQEEVIEVLRAAAAVERASEESLEGLEVSA